MAVNQWAWVGKGSLEMWLDALSQIADETATGVGLIRTQSVNEPFHNVISDAAETH